MNRRRVLLAVSGAAIVAAHLGLALAAGPPGRGATPAPVPQATMATVPAPAVRPAILSLPRQTVAPPVGTLDFPKPTLMPVAKPDGPTTVLTPSAPESNGMALFFATTGYAIGVFSPGDGTIQVTQDVDLPNGSASVALIQPEFTPQPGHGYLVTCLVTNTGTSNLNPWVIYEQNGPMGSPIIAPGHSGWLSHDFAPSTPAYDVSFQIMTSKMQGVANKYVVTRCEITSYTIVR